MRTRKHNRALKTKNGARLARAVSLGSSRSLMRREEGVVDGADADEGNRRAVMQTVVLPLPSVTAVPATPAGVSVRLFNETRSPPAWLNVEIESWRPAVAPSSQNVSLPPAKPIDADPPDTPWTVS